MPPTELIPTPETVPLSVPDVTNPRYSYGGAKIASEIAVLAYAKEGALGRTIIIRPHNLVGPDAGYEHVIPQLAQKILSLNGDEKIKILGSGLETRCFCYIDDAVDGLMIAMEKGTNGIYHLGTQEETSILSLADKMLHYYLQRSVRIIPSELPKGSPMRRVPDISKLRSLGYEPKFALDDMLPPTLDWYRDNPV